MSGWGNSNNNNNSNSSSGGSGWGNSGGNSNNNNSSGNKNNNSGWGNSGGSGSGGSGSGGWGNSSSGGNNNNNSSGGSGSSGWGNSSGSGGGGSSGWGNSSGSGGGSSGWGNSSNNNNNNSNNNNNNNSNQNPYSVPGGNLSAMGVATAAQYLAKWDSVYNASHPNCHFRTFLLNMCPPGQSRLAVEREKWYAQGRGGGPAEETWLAAVRDNPDPDNFFPAPVHFAFGLEHRQTQQLEQIQVSHTHVTNIKAKQETLHELHERNEQRLKNLVGQEALIERKLLLAMSRAEVLRRSGIRISTAEEHDIQQKINVITATLSGVQSSTASAIAAMNSSSSNDLVMFGGKNTPLLTSHHHHHHNHHHLGSTSSSNTIENRISTLKRLVETQDAAATADEDERLVRQLGQSVDAQTLRDWAKLLAVKDNAIRALQRVVRRDLEDVQAVFRRINVME